MHARTKKLRRLMREHNLTSPDVGQRLNRKAGTVRIWRMKKTKRPIPENELLLLEMQLGSDQVGPQL